MEFKFEANQDFQLRAIEAVADLFEGQRRLEVELELKLGGIPAVGNRLDLTEGELRQNMQVVQERNGIRPDRELKYLEERVRTIEGVQKVRFANFSVEMETGTGKTYVYVRTALELFRRYGYRKFIIVVPSVAIREGVLKTLAVTRKHLEEVYGNTPYRFYGYDSANLAQVRQFALSDSVELMVMTLAAFNKADQNVIHQTTDRLQGEMPVHLIQAARPILILDEPQNMESERSIAALAGLQPLFALRYSATHRVPYNVVYRLSPFEAYRLRLVKRIEVGSVVKEGDVNRPYIRLVSISAEKHTLTARLTAQCLLKTGQIQERTLTVRPGDSLEEKTGGRPIYAEYTIDEINAGLGCVRFGNNVELKVGEELGAEKEAVFEAQIRFTIEEHLRKQAMLRPAGVKVLSLFFIDKVDSYAAVDGVIRRLFKRAFEEVKGRHPEWRGRNVEEVQAAYFAQRATRQGAVFEDSTTGKSAQDRAAYELIMREKERLLSLEEPVSFIFSHSALREGWDNPNVFQICTLNQTQSEVRRRQEVGRGVRLAVNQNGERVTDERINVLTVVANERYEQFVAELQSEIAAEYREEIEARYGKAIEKLSEAERRQVEAEYGQILPPPPANARERVYPKLRKEYTLKPEFEALWERIKHKTRYAVKIETERLIEEVVAELGRVEIRPPRVAITKAKVDLDTGGAFQAWQMSAAKTLVSLVGRYPVPNVVEIMMSLMEQTSPPMRLTRGTLLEIVRRAPKPEAMVENPTEFATAAVGIIKQKLADQLVQGIRYEKIEEWYRMELFEEEMKSWKEYIVPAKRGLYDQVICDSQVERDFVKGLEEREDVRLYVKLPDWFKVPTPIGNYNPDWAIVMEDPEDPEGELLYLVSETKGSLDTSKLQYTHERRKIECGRRHFEGALKVPYRVMTSVGDLPQRRLKV